MWYICYISVSVYVYVQILKQENSQLKNRSELVTQCSTGPQVFINCAGFIRIDTSAFNDAYVFIMKHLQSTNHNFMLYTHCVLVHM